MVEKEVKEKGQGNSSARQGGGQGAKEKKSAKTITKPESSPVVTEDKHMDQELERFKEEIGNLVKNAVDGKLDVRADVNEFEGSYREMAQGVNDLIDAFVAPFNVAAEYVDRISKGDIPEKITDEYKGDFNEIKNNLNGLIDALTGLINEAATMEKAAAAGELDTRADVSRYNGAWATIVQGLNNTAEGAAVPIKDIGNVLDKMAAGELKSRVVNDYKGAYNVLKVACNELGEQLQGVQEVLEDIKSAAVAGKLDARGEASRFKGEIAGMVTGMNDVLDAVIGPLNVAAEYVDRISKGDIPEKITDEYKGDFNEIKNNLNVCIDAINGLTAEAGMLTDAALEGKLDTRGDAAKFGGDFAKIVQGVNNVLDAVIGPLNVAAEYVDRISKGDIPEKITDEYKGDFNEIKNNLNVCIDAINGLTAEAGMLTDAALEGKLDTRGDAAKFGGDFAKIVQGVNNVLDAVIGPLNVAAEYVDRISKGDIPEKITDEYKGDFNEIKNNLNGLIDALALIAEAAETIAQGDMTVDIQPRSENDLLLKSLSKLVTGLNESLSQVNIAVEQIAAGSGQVSDSAQALSQGATEQASSLEEITSSMNEIASQTKQNAENATQAKQLSAEARSGAEKGDSQMKEMVEAMEEINESSQNISKIIKVIDEIAFQTNLLALNAAVEAARAGKHGKGFAVVAEEVRNLAARSAKAAKETAELIEGSVQKVKMGTEIANKTAEALNEIVAGVTKVTDLVGEIAAASNEQAQGVSQINIGLGQIDQVTQQNTATAEESASASEELSGQAAQLREMVAKFKLTQQNGNGHRLGMEQIPVEMFEMFQKMMQQKGAISTASHGGNGKDKKGQWGKTSQSIEQAALSEGPKPVIALDDKEFGRY